MTLRASGTAEICFGPIPVFVKLYSVASEKAVSLSQVHGACGEKLEQQYFCAAHDAVVPRPAIAKQYKLPDGAVAVLTEEDLKTAESDRVGTLEIRACVPEGSVDPIYLGKTVFVGPNEEHGIDGYSTLVDALEATRTAAVGVLYTRTRDQLVLLERYRERGLLMREVFYASEVKAIDELELPKSVRASLPAGAFEQWTAAIERCRRGAFEAEGYRDEYPERVERAAERKARGGDAGAGERAGNEVLKAGRARALKGTVPQGARSEGRGAVVRELRAPVAVDQEEERGEKAKRGR